MPADAAGDGPRGHPGGRAPVRRCVTLVTGARRRTGYGHELLFAPPSRLRGPEAGGGGSAPDGAVATAIVRRAQCPAPQAADRKEESTSHEAASELARPSRRHGAGRALLSHLARPCCRARRGRTVPPAGPRRDRGRHRPGQEPAQRARRTPGLRTRPRALGRRRPARAAAAPRRRRAGRRSTAPPRAPAARFGFAFRPQQRRQRPAARPRRRGARARSGA